MRVRSGFVATLVLMTSFATMVPSSASAAEQHKLLWSIYAGWMPWGYAAETGILAKHAAANGIEVEVQRLDYVPSLEAFNTGQGDAVVVTNMDLLSFPVSANIASTVVVVGDYSNGNDAILTTDPAVKTVADLKGKKIYLVELSVSHFLLVRALEKAGLKETDVEIVGLQDEKDLLPGFLAGKMSNIVTWNPYVIQAQQNPKVKTLATSAEFPGEILDLCVVKSDKLGANGAFAKTLAGTWYEVMGQMTARGPVSEKALTAMAEASEGSLAEFKAQLKTTAMFYTPTEAVKYTAGPEIQKNNDVVRKFCAAHNMLGEGVTSADGFGIKYPDGSVQGDAKRVLVSYDTTWMDLAAKGQLTTPASK